MSNISSVMRKPAFCICQNKGADQMRSAPLFSLHTYIVQSSTFKIRDFKALAIFRGRTAPLVSDLARNPEGFLASWINYSLYEPREKTGRGF